jgi:hypothetical protein
MQEFPSFNEIAKGYVKCLTFRQFTTSGEFVYINLCEIPEAELEPLKLRITSELCPLHCECGTRVYKEELKEFERLARAEVSRALMALRDISVAEEPKRRAEESKRRAEESKRRAEESKRLEQLELQKQENRMRQRNVWDRYAGYYIDPDENCATYGFSLAYGAQLRQEADDKKKFMVAASAAESEDEPYIPTAIKQCFSEKCKGRYKMNVLKGRCLLCR